MSQIKYLLIFLLFFCFSCTIEAQSNINLESEFVVNKYPQSNLLNAFSTSDTLVLVLRTNPYTDQKISVSKFLGSKLISEFTFESEKSIIYTNAQAFGDSYLLSGEFFPDEDSEQTQNILILLDQNGELKWEQKFLRRFEGVSDVFVNKKSISLLSSNSFKIEHYVIDESGTIIDSSGVSFQDYILFAQIVKDQFVVVTTDLDKNGSPKSWQLFLFDNQDSLITQIQRFSKETFFPEKFLKWENEYVLVANSENHPTTTTSYQIPVIYKFAQNLSKYVDNQIHYQPDNYLFKNNFELHDIIIDEKNDRLVASGVVETSPMHFQNIIFEIKETYISGYKLFENTSDLRIRNKLLSSQGQVYLICEEMISGKTLIRKLRVY